MLLLSLELVLPPARKPSISLQLQRQQQQVTTNADVEIKDIEYQPDSRRFEKESRLTEYAVLVPWFLAMVHPIRTIRSVRIGTYHHTISIHVNLELSAFKAKDNLDFTKEFSIDPLESSSIKQDSLYKESI